MSLLLRVFRRLKRSRNRQFFIRKAKAIRDARRLAMRGTSPLFLSMIRHSDVTTYLLAIKSLYTGVGQGRVKIINDGSLTAGDLALLNHHVPGSRFSTSLQSRPARARGAGRGSGSLNPGAVERELRHPG
jgi:hypothetical protein